MFMYHMQTAVTLPPCTAHTRFGVDYRKLERLNRLP
jgi:hypothetical protein